MGLHWLSNLSEGVGVRGILSQTRTPRRAGQGKWWGHNRISQHVDIWFCISTCFFMVFLLMYAHIFCISTCIFVAFLLLYTCVFCTFIGIFISMFTRICIFSSSFSTYTFIVCLEWKHPVVTDSGGKLKMDPLFVFRWPNRKSSNDYLITNKWIDRPTPVLTDTSQNWYDHRPVFVAIWSFNKTPSAWL